MTTGWTNVFDVYTLINENARGYQDGKAGKPQEPRPTDSYQNGWIRGKLKNEEENKAQKKPTDHSVHSPHITMLFCNWKSGVYDCRSYKYEHPWIVVDQKNRHVAGCWTREEAKTIWKEWKTNSLRTEMIYFPF